MRLKATRLDLRAHLEGFLEAFMPLAERRSVALGLATPSDPVEIWADPAHLDKVTSNLLSNALKFTDEGGAVQVALAATEGSARISVRDTGAGIPEGALPRVFDRFYRGEGRAAEVRPGTGIGLALARELVHLYGGTLELESEPGVESTLTVALRLGRDRLDPDQIVEAQPEEDGAPPVSSSISVPALQPTAEGEEVEVEAAEDE